MEIRTKYNVGDIFWKVDLVKSPDITTDVYNIGVTGPWTITGLSVQNEYLYYVFDKKMGSRDVHEFEKEVDTGGEWYTSIHKAADWIRENCNIILEEIFTKG